MTDPIPSSNLTHDEAQQQLVESLVVLRRRLRWRDNLHWLTRRGWLLLLPALAFVALSFFQPIPYASLWALGLLWLALLGWLLWSALRPLPLERVARRVDAEAQSHERLATALELGAAQRREPLALRQQQDASRTAQQLAQRPTESLPWRWERRPLALSGLLLLLILVAPLLPNPQDATLAKRAAIQEVAKEEAEKIDELQREQEEEQALPREKREALLRELEALERALNDNPGDQEQALADIERARQALQERQEPNRLGQEAALDQLAETLQRMSEQPEQDAASAAQSLAEQASSLSQAERLAQASELREQAARAAATDPALAEALQALANGVQAGDSAQASAAAEQLDRALRQAEGALADQEALAEALAQLESSRQALADAPVANAQPGQAQGQGEGQGQGQGQGAGQGSGQGQGQGQRPGGGGGGTTAQDDQGGRDGTGTFQGSDPNNLGTQSEGDPLLGGSSDELLVPEWGDPSLVQGQQSGDGQTQTQGGSGVQPGLNNGALVPGSSASTTYDQARYQAGADRPQLSPFYENLIIEYGERLIEKR